MKGLYEAVGEFEKGYIKRALEAHGGSRVETAAALQISRKSLWEKLLKYEITERQRSKGRP